MTPPRRPRLLRSRMLLHARGRRRCGLYLVTACLDCGTSWVEPPYEDDGPPVLDLVLVPEHTEQECADRRRARDAATAAEQGRMRA